MKWCEDCDLWKVTVRNGEGRPQKGECHRNAPMGISVLGNDIYDPPYGAWPITLPHDFCGEHQEKAA